MAGPGGGGNLDAHTDGRAFTRVRAHAILALACSIRYLRPMLEKPPSDPADHAAEFAHRWADRLDEHCVTRMDELGIPTDKNGEEDPYRPKTWRSFVPDEREGGYTSRGITVNSGCLNPELLKGRNGAREWSKARLRDRIDAIIAHEWEEDRSGSHAEALKAAPTTELEITGGARRILRAMGR